MANNSFQRMLFTPINALGVAVAGVEGFISDRARTLKQWLNRKEVTVKCTSRDKSRGTIHFKLNGVKIVNRQLLESISKELLDDASSIVATSINDALSAESSEAAAASQLLPPVNTAEASPSSTSDTTSSSLEPATNASPLEEDNQLLSAATYSVEFDIPENTTLGELDFDDLETLCTPGSLTVKRADDTLASEEERGACLETLKLYCKFSQNERLDPSQMAVDALATSINIPYIGAVFDYLRQYFGSKIIRQSTDLSPVKLNQHILDPNYQEKLLTLADYKEKPHLVTNCVAAIEHNFLCQAFNLKKRQRDLEAEITARQKELRRIQLYKWGILAVVGLIVSVMLIVGGLAAFFLHIKLSTIGDFIGNIVGKPLINWISNKLLQSFATPGGGTLSVMRQTAFSGISGILSTISYGAWFSVGIGVLSLISRSFTGFKREKLRHCLDEKASLDSELRLTSQELTAIDACKVNDQLDAAKAREYLAGQNIKDQQLEIKNLLNSDHVLQEVKHLLKQGHYILSLPNNNLDSASVLEIAKLASSKRVAVLNLTQNPSLLPAFKDPENNSEWWADLASAVAKQVHLKQVLFDYPPVPHQSFWGRLWFDRLGFGERKRAGDAEAEFRFLANLTQQQREVVKPFFQQLTINRYLAGQKPRDQELQLLNMDEAQLAEAAEHKINHNFTLTTALTPSYNITYDANTKGVQFRLMPASETAPLTPRLQHVTRRNQTFKALISAFNPTFPLGDPKEAIATYLESTANAKEFEAFLETIDIEKPALNQAIKAFLLGNRDYFLSLLSRYQDSKTKQLLLALCNEAFTLNCDDYNELYTYLEDAWIDYRQEATGDMINLIASWPANHRDAMIVKYLRGDAAIWIKEHGTNDWRLLYNLMSQELQNTALNKLASQYKDLNKFSLSVPQVASWLHFLLKHHDRTNKYLQQALDMSPDDPPSGFNVAVIHQRLLNKQIPGYQQLDLDPVIAADTFQETLNYEIAVLAAIDSEPVRKELNMMIAGTYSYTGPSTAQIAVLKNARVTDASTSSTVLTQLITKVAKHFSDKKIIEGFKARELTAWVQAYGASSLMALAANYKDTLFLALMERFIKENLNDQGLRLVKALGDGDEVSGLELINQLLLALYKQLGPQSHLLLDALTIKPNETANFFLNSEAKFFGLLSQAQAAGMQHLPLKAKALQLLKTATNLNRTFSSLENTCCTMLLEKARAAIKDSPSSDAAEELINAITNYYKNINSPDPRIIVSIYRSAATFLGPDALGAILTSSLNEQQSNLSLYDFYGYIDQYLTVKSKGRKQLLYNVDDMQIFTNPNNIECYKLLKNFGAILDLKEFLNANSPSWRARLPDMLSHLTSISFLDAEFTFNHFQTLADDLSAAFAHAATPEVRLLLVKKLSEINALARTSLLKRYFNRFNKKPSSKLGGVLRTMLRFGYVTSDENTQKIEIINWLFNKMQQLEKASATPLDSRNPLVELIGLQLIVQNGLAGSTLEALKQACETRLQNQPYYKELCEFLAKLKPVATPSSMLNDDVLY